MGVHSNEERPSLIETLLLRSVWIPVATLAIMILLR